MKKKLLFLSLIMLIPSLNGCSLFIKNESESTSNSTVSIEESDVEPSLTITPLKEKYPYTGFVNKGYHGSDYFKVTFTNQKGYKSDVSKYPELRWSSSDINVIDPTTEHWFVGNGKATLTATYYSYTVSASASVNMEVYTPVVEEKENYKLSEYRVGESYDLPTSFLPLSSSIFYEVDKEGILEFDEENQKIICVAPGKVKLTTSFYLDKHLNEDKKSYVYDIDVVDKNAPRFIINQEEAFLGTLSAPKNKYSSLSFKNLGLASFDKDNNDITETIEVIEGEYNLSEIGEYKLTLKATDTDGLYSYFYLTLKILEKEVVKTEINETFDSLNNEILDISISHTITNMSTLIWISKVDYSANIQRTTKYDDLDVTIQITVNFKAQDEALDYEYYNTFGYIEGHMSIGSNSITLTGSFPNPNRRHLKASTYEETGYSIKVFGYGYNYIYY